MARGSCSNEQPCDRHWARGRPSSPSATSREGWRSSWPGQSRRTLRPCRLPGRPGAGSTAETKSSKADTRSGWSPPFAPSARERRLSPEPNLLVERDVALQKIERETRLLLVRVAEGVQRDRPLERDRHDERWRRLALHAPLQLPSRLAIQRVH